MASETHGLTKVELVLISVSEKIKELSVERDALVATQDHLLKTQNQLLDAMKDLVIVAETLLAETEDSSFTRVVAASRELIARVEAK